MPKHHTDQNVVGLQDANHGDMIISSPPSQDCNRENVQAGHTQGVSRVAKVPCRSWSTKIPCAREHKGGVRTKVPCTEHVQFLPHNQPGASAQCIQLCARAMGLWRMEGREEGKEEGREEGRVQGIAQRWA